MNESCTQTQNALYTLKPLSPEDYEHIASCEKCKSLQGALNTIDTLFLVQEDDAPSRFAKVMVAQVRARHASRWQNFLVVVGDLISAKYSYKLRALKVISSLACISLALIIVDHAYNSNKEDNSLYVSQPTLGGYAPKANYNDARIASGDGFFSIPALGIFDNILGRSTEADQKRGDAPRSREAREETGAQIAKRQDLAEALATAPRRNSAPQPQGVARDSIEKAGSYDNYINQRHQGIESQPGDEAPRHSDNDTAIVNHDMEQLTTESDNAGAAFGSPQPPAGRSRITEFQYAQARNEELFADKPANLEAIPAEVAGAGDSMDIKTTSGLGFFYSKPQKKQKDARLKKESSSTSISHGADESTRKESSEKKVDISDRQLADDKAPPSSSKGDKVAKAVTPHLPVTYLDPNGYWENTYHPGSPAIPLLLESLHKTIFPQVSMDQILNTHPVFMVQHPVDAPLQGALGLAAHTDVPCLDKPGRVLLQVTIKGADRTKGNRPPLTLVVVIPDSKNIPAQEHKVIRETLRALEAQRRVDDHIAILTDESEVPVPFSDFRYGTLELFLKKLQQGVSTEPLPGGKQALYRTARMLALDDDGTQLRERIILTVGHSGISSFEPAYPEVDSHVLQGGVASVITVTDNIDLLRLSARGQGSYRLIDPTLPAEDQMRTELESYGAVVARALRLNVQLQPGVKLKEIIGSNKLSSPEVEREKAIEVATDRRIAQSLGIEADRGNDDPGIQILIPRFLSGDSHVVILDLFVERAGPVADISLKSKDLVLMRNETLHASAALPPYRDNAGQINSIIAHNEYAQRLATVIRTVRKFAEYGEFAEGVALLQSFAEALDTYAPPSTEKTNTANLINNYIYYLQAMNASSQQGNSTGVREAVTTSLDLTTDRILGN